MGNLATAWVVMTSRRAEAPRDQVEKTIAPGAAVSSATFSQNHRRAPFRIIL